MFFYYSSKIPGFPKPPKNYPKSFPVSNVKKNPQKKGVPSESYTRYAEASDEMREAIGLRALLRSTEFLGFFLWRKLREKTSMRVARQLSCDPTNQGIYAYI